MITIIIVVIMIVIAVANVADFGGLHKVKKQKQPAQNLLSHKD